MKISVIVSSYNQLGTLKLVLESFGSQSDPPLEVIVSDDGSKDGTLKWLEAQVKEKRTYELRFVTREHQGYRLASLQNLGAKQATGQRLLFTNADVIHYPTSILGHSRLAEKELGVGLIRSIARHGVAQITPEIIRTFDKVMTIAKNCPHQSTNSPARVWAPCPTGPNRISDIRFIWGGNFTIDAALFVKLGGFDENYVGWGGEDSDLARRCMKTEGGVLTWVDESIGFHLDHPRVQYHVEKLGTKRFQNT